MGHCQAHAAVRVFIVVPIGIVCNLVLVTYCPQQQTDSSCAIQGCCQKEYFHRYCDEALRSAHRLRQCRHSLLPEGVGASRNPLEAAQLEILQRVFTPVRILACQYPRGRGGMAVGRLGGARPGAVSNPGGTGSKRGGWVSHPGRAGAGMYGRAVGVGCHPVPLEGALHQLLDVGVRPPAHACKHMALRQ